MFFMPEPVQRCQSTSRNLRAVSSNSGNHPLALSFLDLPTGSWVKRCCTLYTGLPVSVQSDCAKVLSVSFHRICVTSYTGWTFLSGCNGPSMSAAQSTTAHDGLLHPHLRHCSSTASAVRRLPSAVRTMTLAFDVWLSGFYREMLCIRGTSHGPVSVCLRLCLSVCVCLSQVGVLL